MPVDCRHLRVDQKGGSLRQQWKKRLGRGLAAGLVAILPLGAFWVVGAAPAAAQITAGGAPLHVIVALNGGGNTATAERVVTRLGGAIDRRLPIVNGFTATVPAAAVVPLRAVPGIRSVTPDASGHVTSVDPSLGYDQNTDEGSLSFVARILHVQDVWNKGLTGKGVDVALVDTGVAKVPGLTSGNVVNGPDLSFESQYADVRYRDTFGHGTHMASIIAGRDAVGTPASYATSTKFNGIAPDARIISLKVGASNGAADVSQVIAAIDWVTQHAHDPGFNIRVLNLSYGTDSTQSYTLDPLCFAVEQAWRRGIVVVVAAGNDGTTRQELASPATDPYVVAVGADDPVNTLSTSDDTVPAFAQRGTAARHVDVVAPGVHILGLRVPNGYVDQNNAAGRVGTRFMRGSGTSQATAVVSGVAALLLQKYPTATPDQMKFMLALSAFKFSAKDTWQGTGVIDAAKGLAVPYWMAPSQSATAALGTGTLEGARGSSHVSLGGAELAGERDIFGQTWKASTWASAVAANKAWSGGTFNGTVWTGGGWNADGTWTAATWTARDWTGVSWTSRSWVSRSWVANGWDSRSWVDSSWYSRSWVADGWADATWS
jgi:serine protease AprX